MDTWKTKGTDRLIEDVIEEVKARLGKIQEESCGASHTGKVLVLGKLDQAEENMLRSFANICTSPETGEWDFIVAAQVSAGLLAFTALGIPGQPEAKWILEALLGGKKVYSLEKGLEYRKYRETSYKALYQKYQEYEEEIRRFGGEIVTGIQEAAELEMRVQKNACIIAENDSAPFDLTRLKLLGEADLGRLRGTGYRTVLIGRKTIITPLAKDYISNHNLTVRRQQ